ncbi:hypothetical protein KFU94_68480 [Chloroflexi bacterium TSY]|nr:hypothetical protein [Chloroflexi bacterium TSY]
MENEPLLRGQTHGPTSSVAILSRLKHLRVLRGGSFAFGAHPKPVAEGIPFLGFIVYPDRRRLKRRKGIHYRRKLSRLIAAYRANEISLEQIDASVQGWINHVHYGNTIGLRKSIFSQSI